MRRDLHLARAVEQPHQRERLRERRADRHGAMIAQQQHRPPARALDDPAPLVETHGDPFEVVIRDLSVQLRRIEIGERQAVARAAHGHRRRRMHVHHAMRVGQRRMDRRVECEAGRIDRPVGMPDHVAVDVDLHEIRRADLTVMEPERIDQEVAVLARHAQRDMVVDQLGPAEMIEDPVSGRELHARLPFGFGETGGTRKRLVQYTLHGELRLRARAPRVRLRGCRTRPPPRRPYRCAHNHSTDFRASVSRFSPTRSRPFKAGRRPAAA